MFRAPPKDQTLQSRGRRGQCRRKGADGAGQTAQHRAGPRHDRKRPRVSARMHAANGWRRHVQALACRVVRSVARLLLACAAAALHAATAPFFSQRDRLRQRLGKASSHAEWLATAGLLDAHLASDAWRAAEESTEYDYKLIAGRLAHLRSIKDDEEGLPSRMFFIRAGMCAPLVQAVG